MTRVLILVEGQSEEIFVKRTLMPYLAERKLYVKPTVLWTNRKHSGGGYRGGVSSWKKIRQSLDPLTFDTNAWVTTLLDFYGLPEDVPGYQDARKTGNPHENIIALQNRLAAEIAHPRFIPFLALHEFEAWVFCDADAVAAHFGCEKLAEKLRHAGKPERINHGKDTHPKARLKKMIASYKETVDSPILLEKIGIPAIRAACPHFAAWLGQLEALVPIAG